MANVMRKTHFFGRGTREREEDQRSGKRNRKKKKAGSAKETRHVEILRRKDRYTVQKAT